MLLSPSGVPLVSHATLVYCRSQSIADVNGPNDLMRVSGDYHIFISAYLEERQLRYRNDKSLHGIDNYRDCASEAR